jgi:phenylpyruvate tautomerase PptA (4-oxalocrotonate tautomerase family)
MPKLDITIPAGVLSDEARRELPETLGATLLHWEGAPDTEFFRSITWAHLNELPAEAIRTPDGEAEPHIVVDVTVPQGALSDRRKAGLVDQATADVLGAVGWDDEAALRVWVLIHEVPEGNWGAGKQIIRFEQLKEAARAEREKAEGKEPAEATA